MMTSVIIFGRIITERKPKIKKIIIAMLVSVILHTSIYLLFDGILKTMLLCLIYAIAIQYLYGIDSYKSVLMCIIYTLLMTIPDLIVLTTAIYAFKIEKETFYSTIAGSITGNIIVSFLMIAIVFILRNRLRKILNKNVSINKKIVCIAALILITLLIFFYNLIKTFKFNNDIAGFILAIALLIIILFYIFKQKMDNENILKKYDELLDIMKNYESDIEEQRTLIHETRNELSTIRCKIKDKEKESEIIEYIDSIIGDKVSSKMSKYSKFKYLPSNGLKGFFYYKFSEAERRGIDVSLNISKQIENSILGKLDTKNFKDLARVIGVYLDNAIEASSDSKAKNLGIEIYSIKGNIEIIISNTYNNSIDKDKIGNEKTSTKGEKRGHGLLLVKKILGDSKIIKSENQITDKLYIQKIVIKNEKNQ